jgi:hypothetical protein
MNTPTLIEMIQAARDVEGEALEEAQKGYKWAEVRLRERHSPIAYEYGVRAGFNQGANFQHSRLSPALICAVEALEFYAKGGNPSRDLWEDKELGFFTGKRAQEHLTRMREMLEGKEPKV